MGLNMKVAIAFAAGQSMNDVISSLPLSTDEVASAGEKCRALREDRRSRKEADTPMRKSQIWSLLVLVALATIATNAQNLNPTPVSRSAAPPYACNPGALSPKGPYFVYTSNLDHLSNDAVTFDGLMTAEEDVWPAA